MIERQSSTTGIALLRIIQKFIWCRHESIEMNPLCGIDDSRNLRCTNRQILNEHLRNRRAAAMSFNKGMTTVRSGTERTEIVEWSMRWGEQEEGNERERWVCGRWTASLSSLLENSKTRVHGSIENTYLENEGMRQIWRRFQFNTVACIIPYFQLARRIQSALTRGVYVFCYRMTKHTLSSLCAFPQLWSPSDMGAHLFYRWFWNPAAGPKWVDSRSPFRFYRCPSE